MMYSIPSRQKALSVLLVVPTIGLVSRALDSISTSSEGLHRLTADLRGPIADFTSLNVAFVTGYVGKGTVTNIPTVPSPGHSFFLSNQAEILNTAARKGWNPVVIRESEAELSDYIHTTMAGKKMKLFPQSFVPDSYSFVVWCDNKFDINAMGTHTSLTHWDPNTAVQFHQHPEYCCGADLELKRSIDAITGQERYRREQHRYENYIAEEQKKGFAVHGERHFQGGFIIYNLKHRATKAFQDTWLRHIQRCGIQDQISLYFVVQQFPEPVISTFQFPIAQEPPFLRVRVAVALSMVLMITLWMLSCCFGKSDTAPSESTPAMAAASTNTGATMAWRCLIFLGFIATYFLLDFVCKRKNHRSWQFMHDISVEIFEEWTQS
jgi:hypothetical protein